MMHPSATFVCGCLAIIGILIALIILRKRLKPPSISRTGTPTVGGSSPVTDGLNALLYIAGVGVFVTAVLWFFGSGWDINPLTTIEPFTLLLLGLTILIAGIVLSRKPGSGVKTVVVAAIIILLGTSFSRMYFEAQRQLRERTPVLTATQKQWAMLMEKFDERSLLPYAWGESTVGTATVARWDDEVIDIKMSYPLQDGTYGLRDFHWDKRRDPNYGTWQQMNPPLRGQWRIGPEVAQDSYKGEFLVQGGTRTFAMSIKAKTEPR